MHRRKFIHQLGAASLYFGTSNFARALAAGSDSAPKLGRIAYQLSYLKNFQFAGEYIADNRQFYQDVGLQVDLVAGGTSVSGDAVVAAGGALVGQSSPDYMANAVNHGAGLKCIGANYQKCVFCIISMGKTPIPTPQDMIGKRIGIQVSNVVAWRAFLKLNKINPSSLTVVPVGYNFASLISGEVDGFFSYANGDLVALKTKGYDVCSFLFADYGYDTFTETYSVSTASLADKLKRAQLVAFVRGSSRGWQNAIQDPALAAKLTVDIYGKGNGLDLKIQEASCVATNEFMVNDETKKNGLFWMSPEAVAKTIRTLAAGGVHATPDMFTNEILEEVHAA